MELPRVFSVSQVNCYLGCSLKYRFQYVEKIPRPWRVASMAFGSSIADDRGLSQEHFLGELDLV